MIIFAHKDGLLPLLHFHRHKLFLDSARLVRRRRRLLAAQRIRISILSRDSVLLGELFRRQRHRQSAIRIRQARHQRVFQRSATQFQSSPRPANHKRRLRHVLHPACQHHRRFAKQQPLRRLRNRLNP